MRKEHVFGILLATVVSWPGVDWAQASETANAPGPVFSTTGPEAEVFGAPDYHLDRTLIGSAQVEHLVATYSRFDQLVAARHIPPASTPWLFKRVAEPAISYRFKSERYSLADYLNRNPTTGLLIAKDDTILAEHYQYARTDRDRFLSQSMAKTITAMLIGIAVDEGKIKSIDDAVKIYVPGLADTEYGRTSLRDLLQMSSGVTFTEDYSGKDDISKLSGNLFSPVGKSPVEAVAEFNSRAEPTGTHFHYASVETEVLGLVLRSAIGMPVANYLRDRLWHPIGAESEASWAIDGTGQEVTFCCFNAVLRDYARFGRLLAQDGAWDGRQLIPKQWLLDATTPPADRHYLAPRVATSYFGYGYQTWILPGQRRMFALLGIRGQMIIVDPASKLVLVHTAVRKNSAAAEDNAETVSLWFGLLDQFGR